MIQDYNKELEQTLAQAEAARKRKEDLRKKLLETMRQMTEDAALVDEYFRFYCPKY